MKIKSGASLSGLQIEMRKVLLTTNKMWKSNGQNLVVTSGTDGTHSAGSMHYYGYALDLRTRYFSSSVKSKIAKDLQKKLGAKYYVLNEKTHIHVQFNFNQIKS